MPSEKILEQKKSQVAELIAKLNESVAGVIVDYKGITVAEDTKLRSDLRAAGVEYTVIKNSLLRFACKEANLEGLTPVLEGTTALAISKDDLVAPAKILNEYAEGSKGKFVVKAGFLEGEVIDTAKVAALAKLPSKEMLLTQLACALNGTIRNFAVVLDQVAKKKEEAAE